MSSLKLVDDTFSLAFDGRMSYDRAFQLIDYLKHETDPVPWLAAVTQLKKIWIHCNPNKRKTIETYVTELIDGVYRHIGFHDNVVPRPNGEHLIYNARNIIYHACHFGHPDCTANAAKAFDDYKSGIYVYVLLRASTKWL